MIDAQFLCNLDNSQNRVNSRWTSQGGHQTVGNTGKHEENTELFGISKEEIKQQTINRVIEKGTCDKNNDDRKAKGQEHLAG